MPEIFDVVNECDEIIGQIDRAEMFRLYASDGVKSKSRFVHVFLENEKGDIWLQQRHSQKKSGPNLLDAPAGGYVISGESYDAAAKRELKEELGVDLPLENIGKIETPFGFCMVYKGQVTDQEFDIDADEILDVYLMPLQQVYDMLQKMPTLFWDSYHFSFNVYWRDKWPLFDIVDDNDQVLRQGSFEEIYTHKLGVRAVNVIVVNDTGDILIQQRSDHVKLSPGRLDLSATGHVDAGESYEMAAKRELFEETGIDAEVVTAIHYGPILGHKFYKLFVVTYNGEVTYPEDEINTMRWMPLDDVKTLMRIAPELCSPAMSLDISHYEAWLAASGKKV